MLTDNQITKLEKNGFNRWTKGDHDRLYVNATQLGLKCTYYKTGSIDRAYFNDELISCALALSAACKNQSSRPQRVCPCKIVCYTQRWQHRALPSGV